MAQTQRIARSFLAELFENLDGTAPEQLADFLVREAGTVDYMPRRDRLVLTFELADEDTPIPYVPTEDEAVAAEIDAPFAAEEDLPAPPQA